MLRGAPSTGSSLQRCPVLELSGARGLLGYSPLRLFPAQKVLLLCLLRSQSPSRALRKLDITFWGKFRHPKS